MSVLVPDSFFHLSYPVTSQESLLKQISCIQNHLNETSEQRQSLHRKWCLLATKRHNPSGKGLRHWAVVWCKRTRGSSRYK